jgi:RimJ/RimL family protein N-acetyltransferase
MEKDDVDFSVECFNRMDFWGEYDSIVQQRSKAEMMRQFDSPSQLAILTERARFVIEKKDRTKIGFIGHWFVQPNRMMEIGYNLIPSERGKGYGTEAAQIMVDYLFLSRDIVRIQAITNVRNKASQRVLEKVGFQREGTIRKSGFVRSEWVDAYLYSILREEWKEPKILTKATRQNQLLVKTQG